MAFEHKRLLPAGDKSTDSHVQVNNFYTCIKDRENTDSFLSWLNIMERV